MMKNLQLINTIKITISIIVVIGVIGFLISKTPLSLLFFQNSELKTDNRISPEVESISYTEKIDNFALQEFNESQKLTQHTKAKTYINYKNSPTILLLPVITTYDKDGLPEYQINSESANYLDEGNIKFIGNVIIKPITGDGHHVETEELFVSPKNNNLHSNSKVNYYDKRTHIESKDGMKMNTKDEKMDLFGYTDIKLDNDQTLKTKNLSIDRSKGNERYHSKFATTYISGDNRVNSEAMDLDMQEKILNLIGKAKIENKDVLINTTNLVIDQSSGQERYYSKHNTEYLTQNDKIYSEAIDIDMKGNISYLYGKVKILQSSGTIIDTNNLEINKSNGMEVYKTNDKIHYKSRTVDLKATGMHYDVSRQIMELNGGVFGVYE